MFHYHNSIKMFDHILTGFTRKVMMILFDELFVVSTISYLFFYLFDQMSEGFIRDFFNMDILLAIVIISGIIATVPEERSQKFVKRRLIYIIPIVGIMMLVGLFIYWKTQDSGSFAIFTSIILTLILAGLSWLLITHSDAV